ncbi:MAG: phosphodiester glycosidase family protein [Ignavibacteriales bacterium]
MKITGWFLSCIFILLSILILPVSTLRAQSRDSIFVEELAPGILHKQIFNSRDTLMINIVRADMSKGNYYVKAVKARNSLLGREKVSEMASRSVDSLGEVICAINADFFNMKTGEVENNMVSEGMFVRATTMTDSPFDVFDNIHSQFGITYQNKPYIERFRFVGNVIFPRGVVENLGRINSEPDSNSMVLYNTYQGRHTPAGKNNWKIAETELVPIRTVADTFYCVTNGGILKSSNNLLRQGRPILSGNNNYADVMIRNIKDGDTIKIVVKLDPNYPGMRTLTGGWPRIVRDGVNIADSADSIEGTFPKFSKVKHPRTGIGFSSDSTIIYFITVDGRQESSSGISLKDFADLMISESVIQGLNLDGGGSTTLVIGDKIVNHPSDTNGERPVGNCLLLMKKKEKQQ